MNYGRYQIIKEVGRGSMGVVYEARDPNIGRIVALKVLRQDRITTETFVNRFLKEAKVVGRLSHPRIVTIYDVGEDHGTIYIAMEFLEGAPLSELISNRRFDAGEVVELGIQIAATLEYAHQKGVVHRDVKPSNIIISQDGQIKITDFGIAHIEDSTATLQTQAGEIMGTPAYMSPEQVQGNPVDCRSDLFSLGIILYELSTGTRPFGGEGKGLATIFNEIMLTNPHEPYKESQSIPKGLSRIIMKALEKEPEKRFQSGRELVDALQECAKGKINASEASPIQPGQTMKLGLPVAVALTAVIAAGGIYFLSRHKEPSTEKQPAKPVLVETAPLVKSELPPLKPASAPTPPKPAPTNRIKPAPAEPASVKQTPIKSLQAKPAPVTLAPPLAPERAKPKKPEAKPPEIPETTRTGPISPLSPPSASKPLPKFAFLKIRSIPEEAKVYIDGAFKGNTPITMKIGLGEYQVRLSMQGYHDDESKIKLEKMTMYPIAKKLKPIK